MSDVFRAKVNLETAKMPWREMQRYFAGGVALYVSSELDLVEAAFKMSESNATLVRQWMEEGKFGKVSDEQARIWFESDAMLWAVVVSPWVLVQTVQ
jgi:hypothetical protein